MSERRTPMEELILEVLAARHRLGEPWWTFSRAHRAALERLRVAGLVEVCNDVRAELTEAGRADRLDPGWKSAYERAAEMATENIFDVSAMGWWYSHARTHRFGMDVALELASDAHRCFRDYGRLLSPDVQAMMERSKA